jgi:hypothetical protein
MKAVLDKLSATEKLIFTQVIAYELEKRHEFQPDYKQPLRRLIEQATK